MFKKFKDFFKKYGLSLLVAAGVGALMFFGLGMGPLLAALGTALSGIFTFGAQEAIIKRINKKTAGKLEGEERTSADHGANSSESMTQEQLNSAQVRSALGAETNRKNMFDQSITQQQAGAPRVSHHTPNGLQN